MIYNKILSDFLWPEGCQLNTEKYICIMIIVSVLFDQSNATLTKHSKSKIVKMHFLMRNEGLRNLGVNTTFAGMR